MVEKRKKKQALGIEVATKREEDLIKHGFGGKSFSRASPELYTTKGVSLKR